MAMTVAEAVDIYARLDPHYIPNMGDRIWMHDLLHTILGTSNQDGRGELVTAIYQSVLSRSLACATIRRWPSRSNRQVSIDDIKTVTLPSIRDFVKKSVNVELRSKLSEEEIAEHYEKANILDLLFLHHLGKPLKEFTPDELKPLPISDLTKLVHRMSEIYDARAVWRNNTPTGNSR